MAIRVKVRNNRQIIVPIRFTRAVTGPPVIDAPDVDDRGFAMGNRPGTWGSTNARGAMVTMTEADTVRIKVVREDIDASAPLFVTSSDTGVVTIAGPAGPLGADDVFSITGVVDAIRRDVKVQVRLGSGVGPVVGELEPHIFQIHRVRVVAHLVTINGVSTARTAASLTPLFVAANDIWRAAGIEFTFREAETRGTPGQAGDPEAHNGFAVAGQVGPDSNPPAPTDESAQVTTRNPDRNAINCYFVATAANFVGLTSDRDFPANLGHGVILIDAGDANDLAHELGHFLDLDTHTGDDVANNHIRDDVVTERHLMYNFNPFNNAATPAHRLNVTYGTGLRGALIAVKDFPFDPTDGSVTRSRRRARPVPF